MCKLVLFLLMAWGSLTLIMAAKRSFNLVIYNVTCNKYAKRITRFDCTHRKVSTGCYSSDYSIMLDQTLDKDADLQFLVTFIPMKGAKLVKFLDVKINICDALSQSNSSPLLKSLLEEFKKKSDLPNGCPVKGGYLYSVANYSVDSTTLPPYAPILTFNCTVTIFEHNKRIASIRTMGATVPRL
ncbi:uncharacterized protein LOC106095420 [Stomoxys calcitrans]|uniref:MD-2-related lipid-recognition domain-containing protein n=1 Tax=Stomoxys calcitrans TaxID=35570 RepID=A0A1I8PFX5_STOCA|nr:uncharacterized protein LOC106095420 [Stomoxys calcitrans]